MKRGSIFSFIFPYIISVLTNFLLLALMAGISASYTSNGKDIVNNDAEVGFGTIAYCSSGLWAAAMAMIVYESSISDEPTRKYDVFVKIL